MVSCAACSISKTKKCKKPDITFHQFPKGESRASWFNFINKPEWIDGNSVRYMCSRYFNEECFDRTSPNVVRLKPKAIPTIAVNRVKFERKYNVLAEKEESKSGY